MALRSGQSLVAALLLLTGCADNPPAVIENKSVAAVDVPPEVRQANANSPDYRRNLATGPDYVVEQGDTLYAVAFRLGVDYRTLASLNNIDPPYVIRVGQALKTVPDAAPGSGSAAPEVDPPGASAVQRVNETNANNGAGSATAAALSRAARSTAPTGATPSGTTGDLGGQAEAATGAAAEGRRRAK